ncbi:MAG: alginate export family protein [Deltaproteobacteria bacterium]|nr:alginate export family protein [Deltaproteobacteria bacterium]
MRVHWRGVLILLVCGGLLGLGGPTCKPALAGKRTLPAWAQEAKQPVPWFDWGMDFRARLERFPNVIDRTPGSTDPIGEWYRLRTRVYFNIKPSEDFKLKVRFTNESRPIMRPDHYRSANPHDMYDHFDEVLVDNLSIEWRNAFDLPITLRIGRQDMLAIPGTTGPNGTGFGNGFIFMDGTPGDGSRTFFFDAIRITLDLSSWIENSSLDIIAMNNDNYTHHHLPVIGNTDYRKVNEWSDESYTLYFKNASWIPRAQLDLYYMYEKKEYQHYKRWERRDAYLAYGTHINMIGAFLAGKLDDRTTYVLEGAVQFGAWGGADRRGLGTQASIERTFPGWGNPALKLRYIFLSGDDPDTSRNEAWDVMYSRWPYLDTELNEYLGARENGVYYLTNLHAFAVQGKISLSENVTFKAISQFLWADENTFESGFGAKSALFGHGNYRGWNPIFIVKWEPATYFNTHILWEYLDAGDYFEGTAKDNYYFLQVQVYMKF